MRIVELKTRELKAQGLIGMHPIPEDTVFVFTNVLPGQLFHSRGVLEPFDIVFHNLHGNRLAGATIYPPHGTATAPAGTTHAIESKRGILLT